MNNTKRAIYLQLLLHLLFAVALPSIAFAAPSVVITPTTSFTARLIGGNNVLVGAPNGTEGTAWLSNFLDIKEATSDRVILEYDIENGELTDSAVLSIELTNLDVPDSTTIYLYSFDGNGRANAADYFKTTNLVTTFTDNGLASNFIPPYHIPFSFDVTAAYNAAVSQNRSFLGILFKNTTAESQYARYRLTTFGGLPKLTVAVPEPNAALVAIAALVGAYSRRTKRIPHCS